jgi:ABC-2 type transport system permease protein
MRAYLALTWAVYKVWNAYRFSAVFTLAANLLYMVVIYFLWRSIYGGAGTLRGMSFNQAFVYLTLAGSIFNMLKTWTDWSISRDILNGRIVIDLIRPLDYQLQMLFSTVGSVLFNLAVIGVPSVALLVLAFGAQITPGIGLLFFPAALVFAFLLSFLLDYIVGLTSFYTESLWGISMTKEIIVSVFSGALVPLQFFPELAQALLRLLPFQAIYHIPLSMVVTPDLGAGAYLSLLGTQLFWVAALFAFSRLFYARASRVLFINGG